MKIEPYLGDQPLEVSGISVQADPQGAARINALCLRAKQILKVDTDEEFHEARRLAGELKSASNDLDEAKKASKRPFTGVNNAIEDLAKEIGAPLVSESARILKLLNSYVARLEAIEAEQRRKEALRRTQEAAALRLAQEQERKATEALKRATDEAERLKLKAAQQEAALEAARAELAQAIALEAAAIGNDEPPRGKVPGGRVDHPWEFKVIDLGLAIKEGYWRLFRWELDKLACQDLVKAQLETRPDQEPHIPGIEITRRISVSVKAAARIKQ